MGCIFSTCCNAPSDSSSVGDASQFADELVGEFDRIQDVAVEDNAVLENPSLDMRQTLALTRLQVTGRQGLHQSFPRMLREIPNELGTRLLTLPASRQIPGNDDDTFQTYIWAGRKLVVHYDQLLGAGRTNVYYGELSGLGEQEDNIAVAIKVGEMPELELNLLERLLVLKDQGVRMVVPLPVNNIEIPEEILQSLGFDESSFHEARMGVMPYMDDSLEDHLQTVVDTNEHNRLCADADTLVEVLRGNGIILGDSETNANFLVQWDDNTGRYEVYVSDFGNAVLVVTQSDG